MKLVRNLLFLSALAAPVPALADSVLVFAAASLRDALTEIAGDYEAEAGHEVVISFAGSSALARQIQNGAPADLFLSANLAWMDALEDEGLIDAGSRRDLLGNSLVLIASGAGAAPIELSPDTDLPALLDGGRLAMALVEAVPAGIYGKAALTSLGLWDSVADSVVQTDNVRAALALVALGEAPLGVVYATDAAAEPNVSAVATFPPDSHPAIVYPAGAVADSDNPLNGPFLDYLASPPAAEVFARMGFEVLE
ncbi:molybdate ABC transporter substrate-binding protein [Psychromarinibacter sp. S121]|uniref:molybdate ABC transporter substrate-binding protein n=1 Tax=Psychromarinibacter sp. S121 TaxID=3415127 RepID=UPI003C7A530F